MGTTFSTPSWWLQPNWEFILRLLHQRFASFKVASYIQLLFWSVPLGSSRFLFCSLQVYRRCTKYVNNPETKLKLYLNLQGYEPERSVIEEAQRLSKEVRSSSGVVIYIQTSCHTVFLCIHNNAFSLSMGPSLFWPPIRWRPPTAAMFWSPTPGSAWDKRRRRKKGSKTLKVTRLQCR